MSPLPHIRKLTNNITQQELIITQEKFQLKLTIDGLISPNLSIIFMINFGLQLRIGQAEIGPIITVNNPPTHPPCPTHQTSKKCLVMLSKCEANLGNQKSQLCFKIKTCLINLIKPHLILCSIAL